MAASEKAVVTNKVGDESDGKDSGKDNNDPNTNKEKKHVKHVHRSRADLSQTTIVSNLQKQIYAIQFLHQKHSIDGKPARVVLLPVDSSDHCKQAVKWASHHILKPDDIVILFSIWEKQDIMDTMPDLTFNYGDPLVGYIPPKLRNETEINKENKEHFVEAKKLVTKLFKDYIAPEIKEMKKNDEAQAAQEAAEAEARNKEIKKDKKDKIHHTHEIHTLSLLIPTESRPSTDHIGQMIIDNAITLKCDLIAMGSRGVGHLQSMIMGSVSEYVVKHAKGKVPVCVIHQ